MAMHQIRLTSRKLLRSRLFSTLLHGFMAVEICQAQSSLVKIEPGDAGAVDLFGLDLTISNSTIVVGATRHDHGGAGRTGAAYIFCFDGTSWFEVVELLASDGDMDDGFGRPALIGHQLLVAAPTDESIGLHSGSAYSLELEGSSWVEKQKLAPEPTGENDLAGLGTDLAISGIFAAFGAECDGSNCNGALYVFEKIANRWIQQGHLIPENLHWGAHLGASVGISGNVIVGGAPDWGGCVPSSGEAFVYEKIGPTWLNTAHLCSQPPDVHSNFGRGVAICGDTIAVGAPYETDANDGRVHVFRNEAGVWVEQEVLSGDPADKGFGWAVALHGNLMLVGVRAGQGAAASAGIVWLFERSKAGFWLPKERFFPADGQTYDLFGSSMALGARFGVAGAMGADTVAGQDAGAAYVFPVGLGERYCTSTPNSRSAPAEIQATGTTSVIANDLRFSAIPVPIGQVGIFACGSQQKDLPFGDGRLCIGGTIIRVPPVRAEGEVLLGDIDNTLPRFAGRLVAGSTWHFQAWFRDPAAGGAGFNTSDALTLQFTP